jgi:4-diphosphocytidyl-2-C-methyl-D-erythritol kinase
LEVEPAYYVVLTPPVPQIFASEELTRNTNPTTIAAFSRALKSGNIASDGLFNNDLEPVVCRQYPIVGRYLEELNRFSQARMSGSGASVFAEFDSRTEAELVLSKALSNKLVLSRHVSEVNSDINEELHQIAGFMAQGLDQHPLYNFAD